MYDFSDNKDPQSPTKEEIGSTCSSPQYPTKEEIGRSQKYAVGVFFPNTAGVYRKLGGKKRS